MAMRSEAPTSGSSKESLPFMQIGKDQTNAMIELQKEVFSAYEEAGRAWIARVKSEVELWSDLAAKLSSSKSVPDGLVACQDYVAQRMRMAAEDGRRLFEEGQKIIGTISRSMPNGPKAGT